MGVYEDFAAYAGGLPVVAYNLEYDWDKVLVPEWRRLGISPIGVPGFCALKLAQRLLDPVPAGNCKLQTLRQYFRLPENGAHTALGDVRTVIDLMRQVLRPLAEKRGITTWDALAEYAGGEWYPSRLPFGKFKGRHYREATQDCGLRAWLEWLSDSSNEKSSSMGRWYLTRLDLDAAAEDVVLLDSQSHACDGPESEALVLFQQPEIGLYQRLVESARTRLAELELEYGVERAKVDSVRSRLFGLLRALYRERPQTATSVSTPSPFP